jgi:hypothetical protein
MNRAGLEFSPSTKGAGSVFSGLSAIHQRLALRSDGSPGLKIFKDRCPNLVRELTSLVYDPRHVEEFDPSCSSHNVDALRYSLLDGPAASARYVPIFGL